MEDKQFTEEFPKQVAVVAILLSFLFLFLPSEWAFYWLYMYIYISKYDHICNGAIPLY